MDDNQGAAARGLRPQFLVRDPTVEDLVKLFEQLTGRPVTDEELWEMVAARGARAAAGNAGDRVYEQRRGGAICALSTFSGKNPTSRVTEAPSQSARYSIQLISGTRSSVPCTRSDACRTKGGHAGVANNEIVS
jgi:hypothetical protein